MVQCKRYGDLYQPVPYIFGASEAGVGTASVVALYGPLAREDQAEVNSILSASRRFYNRSGYLFWSISGQALRSCIRI